MPFGRLAPLSQLHSVFTMTTVAQQPIVNGSPVTRGSGNRSSITFGGPETVHNKALPFGTTQSRATYTDVTPSARRGAVSKPFRTAAGSPGPLSGDDSKPGSWKAETTTQANFQQPSKMAMPAPKAHKVYQHPNAQRDNLRVGGGFNSAKGAAPARPSPLGDGMPTGQAGLAASLPTKKRGTLGTSALSRPGSSLPPAASSRSPSSRGGGPPTGSSRMPSPMGKSSSPDSMTSSARSPTGMRPRSELSYYEDGHARHSSRMASPNDARAASALGFTPTKQTATNESLPSIPGSAPRILSSRNSDSTDDDVRFDRGTNGHHHPVQGAPYFPGGEQHGDGFGGGYAPNEHDAFAYQDQNGAYDYGQQQYAGGMEYNQQVDEYGQPVMYDEQGMMYAMPDQMQAMEAQREQAPVANLANRRAYKPRESLELFLGSGAAHLDGESTSTAAAREAWSSPVKKTIIGRPGTSVGPLGEMTEVWQSNSASSYTQKNFADAMPNAASRPRTTFQMGAPNLDAPDRYKSEQQSQNDVCMAGSPVGKVPRENPSKFRPRTTVAIGGPSLDAPANQKYESQTAAANHSVEAGRLVGGRLNDGLSPVRRRAPLDSVMLGDMSKPATPDKPGVTLPGHNGRSALDKKPLGSIQPVSILKKGQGDLMQQRQQQQFNQQRQMHGGNQQQQQQFNQQQQQRPMHGGNQQQQYQQQQFNQQQQRQQFNQQQQQQFNQQQFQQQRQMNVNQQQRPQQQQNFDQQQQNANASQQQSGNARHQMPNNQHMRSGRSQAHTPKSTFALG